MLFKIINCFPDRNNQIFVSLLGDVKIMIQNSVAKEDIIRFLDQKYIIIQTYEEADPRLRNSILTWYEDDYKDLLDLADNDFDMVVDIMQAFNYLFIVLKHKATKKSPIYNITSVQLKK